MRVLRVGPPNWQSAGLLSLANHVPYAIERAAPISPGIAHTAREFAKALAAQFPATHIASSGIAELFSVSTRLIRLALNETTFYYRSGGNQT